MLRLPVKRVTMAEKITRFGVSIEPDLLSKFDKIIKKEHVPLINIIRGPPDEFYIVIKRNESRIQLIKVPAYYQALSKEIERAFIKAVGTRGHRRATDENGNEVYHFGFKVINDALSRALGNYVIRAINVALYNAFEKNIFGNSRRDAAVGF